MQVDEPMAGAAGDRAVPGAGRAGRPLGRALWLAVVLGAAAVGVAARTVDVADKPVWHDEVYTRIFTAGHRSTDWIDALYTGRVVARDELLAFQRIDASSGPLDTVLGLAGDEPQHPPAYYLLARLWVGALGDDIGALRWLSVVTSLLALLAAAWLGREVFGSRGPPAARARLLLVALVAVSPFAVLYAQEAREYALWTVWVFASSAALLRALRLEAGPGHLPWAAYAALTALGLYTAFSHSAVILAQALFVAARARLRPTREARAAALALLGAAALFLPWALALVRHMDSFRASMAWSSTIVVPRSEVLQTLATSLSRPLLDLWPRVTGPLPWLLVGAAAAGVVAAVVALARSGPRHARLLVVLLVVVPVALLVVPDLAFGGIRSFSTRYLSPSLMAALVAVAYGLSALPGPGLRRAVSAAVLVLAAASAVRDATTRVPWTRELSAGLLPVAAAIDAAPQPLVVADRERHHPGNVLTLANLVGPGAAFLMLDFPNRDALLVEALAQAGTGVWPPGGLPGGYTLFLYAPIPQVRAALEAAVGHPATLVWSDGHVECWRLDPPASPAASPPS